MKQVRTALLSLALVFTLVVAVRAADDEKTLKGTITCGKCDLNESKTCATVIQVKDGDKTVVYWFDKAGSDEVHKTICKEAKKGTVTGVLSEKDKKHIITVKKGSVKFD